MDNIGGSGGKSARWICVGLVVAAMAFVAIRAYSLSAVYYGNVVDDSLISMHYARNWVEGHGLVFNVGEKVEGYTNFLWVCVLALLQVLGNAFSFELVPAAVASSIAIASAVVGLVFLIGRRIWGDDWLATLAAVGLVALDSAYAPWAMQALEGHFLLFWMMLSLYLFSARPRGWTIALGLCLAAVQMTRPDGALFLASLGAGAGIGLAMRLVKEGWSDELRGALKAGVITGAVFALTYGVYFALRFSYYGYPLPNTFYLKVGGSEFDAWSRGWHYLRTFFAERGYVPLAAIAALWWIREPVVRVLAIFAAVHLGYVAYVGGDFYPGHRFLLVLVPVLALLAGRAVHGAGEIARRTIRHDPEKALAPATIVLLVSSVAVAGGLVTVWRIGATKGPAVTEVARAKDTVDRARRLTEWLGARSKPGDSIAVGDIGSSGYYGRLRVIDYYGVVDPVVAHSDVPGFGSGKAGHEKRATTDYVLGKRPTYVKIGYLPVDLHRHGYYLNGEMPIEGVPGIWERDPLLESGRFTTVFDFSRREEGWEAEGDAFATTPIIAPVRGQHPITGARGGLVNTYLPGEGDAAVGTLRSPPFTLDGDLLILRVGGGHDPEGLRVSLIVDGERVHSATGRDAEVLTRRSWDIAPYRGRTATLEFADRATGPWGHLLVDEVQLWSRGTEASAIR